MQDYVRVSVSDIIEQINRKCFLPDIQRDFVWKPNQVYALFDSLMRDYPIGTLLLWAVDGGYLHGQQIKRMKFVSRSDEVNQEDSSYDPDADYLLTLDGQQRLTTLYLVLKGNYVLRKKTYDLYFNILSGKKEVDDALFEFRFFNSTKGDSFNETTPDEKTVKLWYKVKFLYAASDIDSIADDFQNHAQEHYSVTIDPQQRKSITKLYRLLRYEQILYYYPEKEKNYDKVLKIFVRINSGGTPLSYSDLLFSTIKSKWPSAREEFKSLLDRMNGDAYDFGQDFILKCILTLHAESRDQMEYRTQNFSPKVIESLRTGGDWARLSTSLLLLVDVVRDMALLTNKKMVPSMNALIPVFYWLHITGKKWLEGSGSGIDPNDMKALRTWICTAMLSNAFGGQSDTVLFRCRSAISASDDAFPASAIEGAVDHDGRRNFAISVNDVDQATYSGKSSYLLLSLAYSSSINFRPCLAANVPQQDHIFSRDELRTAGFDVKDIDSIYNIRYVGAGPNQEKSNKPFEQWIKTQTEENRALHLIPSGDYSLASFQSFLTERRRLFLKQLGLPEADQDEEEEL